MSFAMLFVNLRTSLQVRRMIEDVVVPLELM
jgi:hypothetical protein